MLLRRWRSTVRSAIVVWGRRLLVTAWTTVVWWRSLLVSARRPIVGRSSILLRTMLLSAQTLTNVTLG